MITIELDSSLSIPLYRQLYDYIKKDIVDGKLKADEKLPSKRNLANNLGISILTVETAYSQLCEEGFIYSLPKKGFFISRIKTISSRSVQIQKQRSEADNQDDFNASINLSDNQTEPKAFPFSIWAKLIRQTLSTNQNEVMKNSPSQGIHILRSAIASHLHDFRGMNVEPEQIVIGAGTEYLYILLIQLLGFNKTYAVEDPCHTKINRIYESFGVKNVHIQMDSKGIVINELNKNNADVVHISPSHHFPTGIIMPVARRYELLGWASEKEGRYLIEDDYDSEFRFTGKPLPTLQSIDLTGKVIYMNTFSKTLSSTIRISYMVLPHTLMEEFNRRMNFYSCTVPVIDQFVLSEFISKGYFEKHINRMRKAYSIKREQFISFIHRYDRQNIFSIVEGDSGLHFLLKVKQDKLDVFINNLNSKRIKLNSIYDYYINPQKEIKNIFIVNYSAISFEQIDSVVQQICGCTWQNAYK